MKIIIKHNGSWCLQFTLQETPAKDSKIRLEFNGPTFGLGSGAYIIMSVKPPPHLSLSQFAWEITVKPIEDEPDLPTVSVYGYD